MKRIAREKARWRHWESLTKTVRLLTREEYLSLTSHIDSDWVAAQTRERLRRDMEDQENEYEERLAKARKKEVELRRMARARVSKKPVSPH